MARGGCGCALCTQSSAARHYAKLPKIRYNAGAVIRDSGGRVLLVKPRYRDTFDLPGGHADEAESPQGTAVRECREELGLPITMRRLLCVHFYVDYPKPPAIAFTYDGGYLSDQAISQIVLPRQELAEYRFVPWSEAPGLVRPLIARRLDAIFNRALTGAGTTAEIYDVPGAGL